MNFAGTDFSIIERSHQVPPQLIDFTNLKSIELTTGYTYAYDEVSNFDFGYMSIIFVDITVLFNKKG
jgi:hypothetical protein